MGEDTGIWLRGDDHPPKPQTDGTEPPWPPEIGRGQGDSRRSWVGDRYRIDATLATTPASFVYKAHDVWQESDVVIKEMRRPADCDQEEWKELLIRFEKSASIGHHPSIVEILSYQIRDDVPFLVMEYVAGGDLHKRLYGEGGQGKQAQQPPLSLAEIRAVTDSLLAALEFTHSRGIVHRDIKPANILHSASGQWKLTDFGIARFRSSVHTQHRAFIGTPAYSSPEQIVGDAVDERTDVYSCGVVLYEMLVGQRPFRGSSETVRRLILEGRPLAPSLARMQLAYPGGPVITDALDRVVAQAMAVQRAQRFQTVQEFRAALNEALADPGRLKPQPAVSVGSSRSGRRSFNSNETIIISERPWNVSGRRPVVPERREKSGRLRWVLGVSAIALLAAGVVAVGVSVYREQAVLPFPKLAPPAPPATPPPAEDAASRPKVVFPYVKPYDPAPADPDPVVVSPPVTPPAIPSPAPQPAKGDKNTLPTWQPPAEDLPPPPPEPRLLPSKGGMEQGSGLSRLPSSKGGVDSAGQRPPVTAPYRPSDALDASPGSSSSKFGSRPGNWPSGSNPQVRPPPPTPSMPASPPMTAFPGPGSDTHFLPANPGEPAPSPAPTEARPASAPRETGMTCKQLTPEEAASRNITGVTAPLLLVDGIWNGSAGYAAGIERYDVVQRKGALWLREDGQTYGGCVAYPNAGARSVSVNVWRNGRWQTKTLQWP